jgi:hypothetical protein
MARGLYVRDGEMEVQSRTAVWAGIPTSSDGASVSGPSGAAGPVGADPFVDRAGSAFAGGEEPDSRGRRRDRKRRRTTSLPRR